MLFGTINFKIAALAGVTFSLCCFMPTYATSSAGFVGEEFDVLHNGTFLQERKSTFGKNLDEKVIVHFPRRNWLAIKKPKATLREYTKVTKDLINLHSASTLTQITTDEMPQKYIKKGYVVGICFTAPNFDGETKEWTFYARNANQKKTLETIIIDGPNFEEKRLNASVKKFYEDLEKELCKDNIYNLADKKSLRFPMQDIMNKQFEDRDVRIPQEVFLNKFDNLETEATIDSTRYALWDACLKNNLANKRFGNLFKLPAGWVAQEGDGFSSYSDAFTGKTQLDLPKPAPPAADKQNVRVHTVSSKSVHPSLMGNIRILDRRRLAERLQRLENMYSA